MAGAFDRALQRATRTGLRRGVAGGHEVWLAIGTAALGVRLFRWVARERPIRITHELGPGEGLLIEQVPRPR